MAENSNNPSEKRYFKDAYQLETSDQTRKFYAQWAEIYDQEVDVENEYQQPKRCATAFKAVVDQLDQPILDIGCGTGLSGLALKECGFSNISGCDLSQPMLEKARLTGCYQRLFETNLNAPPIDVASGSFFGISAVGVFSYGHVSPNALDEFLRILKPNGKIVIGLNDHYYDEGNFPAKIEALKSDGKIAILSKEHGLHLKNIEGSMGWVICLEKM